MFRYPSISWNSSRKSTERNGADIVAELIKKNTKMYLCIANEWEMCNIEVVVFLSILLSSFGQQNSTQALDDVLPKCTHMILRIGYAQAANMVCVCVCVDQNGEKKLGMRGSERNWDDKKPAVHWIDWEKPRMTRMSQRNRTNNLLPFELWWRATTVFHNSLNKFGPMLYTHTPTKCNV